MTKDNVYVERDLFNDCMMLTSRTSREYNTYMLFSMILPIGINFRDGIRVDNGVLVDGVVTKRVINRLITHISENYGCNTCATFIKQIQLVALRWMRDRGFTIGLKDCVWDDDDVQEYNTIVKQVETQHNILALSSWVVNKSLEKYVPKESSNPLAVMLHSGAKGKDIGPSQMAISLGQQYVNGKMVKTRLKNNSPHDVGFVSSGYIKGLNPKEYFSQASASLSGIIDIGVGVSAIGYTNRRVTKLMAGVEMEYNGNISTDGQIIRF